MKKTVKIKVFKKGVHKSESGRVVNATDELIKTIVNNYNNQPEETRRYAPLRPETHFNKSKAAGYVESLEEVNGEMFANVYPTPELVEDVRNNRLGAVSIGLTAGDDNLDHIAILGSLKPAVAGLGLLQFSDNEINDFLNLIFSEPQMNPRLQQIRDALLAFINQEFGPEVGTKINAKFDELVQSIPEPAPVPPVPAPAPNPAPAPATFANSEEFKALNLEVQELKLQKRNLEFSSYLDGKLTRILTANKPIALELMHTVADIKETNFSESENGAKLPGIELLKKFIDTLPETINLEREATRSNFSDSTKKSVTDIVNELEEKYTKRRKR